MRRSLRLGRVDHTPMKRATPDSSEGEQQNGNRPGTEPQASMKSEEVQCDRIRELREANLTGEPRVHILHPEDEELDDVVWIESDGIA
jgi:hypothetical protein